MLSLKLPVSSRLLADKFAGSQKLYWIFDCMVVSTPNPRIVQGSTTVGSTQT